MDEESKAHVKPDDGEIDESASDSGSSLSMCQAAARPMKMKRMTPASCVIYRSATRERSRVVQLSEMQCYSKRCLPGKKSKIKKMCIPEAR